jgi:hypothetical protein
VKTQVPLAECVYRMYVAKRAAHLANPSSISESTSFEILTQDSKSAITPGLNNMISTVYEQKHKVPGPFATFSEALLSGKNIFEANKPSHTSRLEAILNFSI